MDASFETRAQPNAKRELGHILAGLAILFCITGIALRRMVIEEVEVGYRDWGLFQIMEPNGSDKDLDCFSSFDEDGNRANSNVHSGCQATQAFSVLAVLLGSLGLFSSAQAHPVFEGITPPRSRQFILLAGLCALLTFTIYLGTIYSKRFTDDGRLGESFGLFVTASILFIGAFVSLLLGSQISNNQESGMEMQNGRNSEQPRQGIRPSQWQGGSRRQRQWQSRSNQQSQQWITGQSSQRRSGGPTWSQRASGYPTGGILEPRNAMPNTEANNIGGPPWSQRASGYPTSASLDPSNTMPTSNNNDVRTYPPKHATSLPPLGENQQGNSNALPVDDRNGYAQSQRRSRRQRLQESIRDVSV